MSEDVRDVPDGTSLLTFGLGHAMHRMVRGGLNGTIFELLTYLLFKLTILFWNER